MTENRTQIDDLVHFTLREWSRLSYNVSEAETERAKAQLKASILLSLDGTTAVAEDIGRQIVTTGRRMNPEEVERVIGSITEKDVMSFARRKLWDQDVAVSAVGAIEGSAAILINSYILLTLPDFWITTEYGTTCRGMLSKPQFSAEEVSASTCISSLDPISSQLIPSRYRCLDYLLFVIAL